MLDNELLKSIATQLLTSEFVEIEGNGLSWIFR